MFKFEHTIYFYAFAAIPAMLVLVVWYFISRRNKLKRMGEKGLIKQLTPYSSRGRGSLR